MTLIPMSEKEAALIRRAFNAVRQATGIDQDDIMGKVRRPEVDTARILLIDHLNTFLPTWSSIRLGRLLGDRHHTAILHAIKTADRRMATDKHFAILAERVLTLTRQPDRFEQWWKTEGLDMTLTLSPKELARIAWDNGQYTANQ